MSPVNSLWFKWKSLRLPWRRSFLVGSDLAGNTFWEFKDALNSKRFRRIVKFSPKTHYADVQVSPQWHQWLRYVRAEPPSIEEQKNDLIRQAQIKQLAQLADERWASKPSYLDQPQTQAQALKPAHLSDATLNGAQNESHVSDTTAPSSSPQHTNHTTPDRKANATMMKKKEEKKEDPFFKHKGGPSETWQPDSWSPSTAKR